MKRLSNLCGHVMELWHGYCRATAPGRAGAQFRSGGRLRAILRSSSDGQSLVEFAFVVPILMALMMGIYAVGIITFNDVALNNAAEIGAVSLEAAGSASGTNMATGSDYKNGTVPLWVTDPCQYAFGQMIVPTSNLLPQNLTVTYKVTYMNNGTSTTAIIGPFTGTAANTCPDHATDFTSGGNLTLIATYPCTLGLYGFNVAGCKLTATASHFIYTS